jgi:ElaA protein
LLEGGVQIGDSVRLEWRGFDDFSAAELYELLRFRQAIFVVEQSSPYADLDGLDQRAHHLLLHVDGALAGSARLVAYRDERRIAIGRVAVAPALRRGGLARELMLEALARCRRDYGDCQVALSAQTYLQEFYESLGFHAISLCYEDHGVPHIDMRREPEPDERE